MAKTATPAKPAAKKPAAKVTPPKKPDAPPPPVSDVAATIAQVPAAAPAKNKGGRPRKTQAAPPVAATGVVLGGDGTGGCGPAPGNPIALRYQGTTGRFTGGPPVEPDAVDQPAPPLDTVIHPRRSDQDPNLTPGATAKLDIRYYDELRIARGYVRDFIAFGRAWLPAMLAEIDMLDAMFPASERVRDGGPCACEAAKRDEDRAAVAAMKEFAEGLQRAVPPAPPADDGGSTGDPALDDLV